MSMSLAQNMTPQNIPHFKKRRLAQLITLTLSLAGYGVVNNSAYAQAAPTPQLNCDVTDTTVLTVDTNNVGLCVISAAGHLTNEMSLRNTTTGELTNYGTLINNTWLFNHGILTNNGTLTSDNTLFNYSTLINTGTLTNTEKSHLKNNGDLYNGSDTTGTTSTLSNSGKLTNSGNLYNASSDGGTSTLTNEADAILTNNYGAVLGNGNVASIIGGGSNGLSGGGSNNLNNSGTLTNDGTLFNASYGEDTTSNLTNSGALTNNAQLITGAMYGATSTLTNEADKELKNTGLLANYSGYGGTSNLNNSGTLTNSGTPVSDGGPFGDGGLLNISYGEGSTSTLTNSGALTNNAQLITGARYGATSTLTNEADKKLKNTGLLGNYSAYGGTSNLNNSGTLTNSGTPTLDDEGNPVSDGGLLNISVGEGSTSTLTNAYGGKLINTGVLINTSSEGGTSILNNTGTVTNNGVIDNNSIITNSGTFDITTDGEMNNTGTFTQTAGRTIVNGIFDGGTLDVQGGSLSGSGTIAADSITIGVSATVKPGNSPGTLIMVGDVDLLGTLQTEIASTSDFDVLEVQGIVTLSDTSAFDFLFDGLFTATDGDSFDFLTALDFNFGSGADFFNLNDLSHFTVTGLDAAFGWSVSFTDNFDPQAQTLSYLSLNIFADDSVGDPDPNAVSAPATLGLFGLALTLMGWGSRRRTKLRAHTA